MARFRATIKGSRGEASRLGSANAGASAKVNGWDIGVNLYASAPSIGDTISVYVTGGSSNPSLVSYLGSVQPDGRFAPSTTLRDQIIADYVRSRGSSLPDMNDITLDSDRRNIPTKPINWDGSVGKWKPE